MNEITVAIVRNPLGAFLTAGSLLVGLVVAGRSLWLWWTARDIPKAQVKR